MIQIRARNLEAEKQALEIERESEEARLIQERDVEFRRAQQRAELARERAERDTEAEQAEIVAREAIEEVLDLAPPGQDDEEDIDASHSEDSFHNNVEVNQWRCLKRCPLRCLPTLMTEEDDLHPLLPPPPSPR